MCTSVMHASFPATQALLARSASPPGHHQLPYTRSTADVVDIQTLIQSFWPPRRIVETGILPDAASSHSARCLLTTTGGLVHMRQQIATLQSNAHHPIHSSSLAPLAHHCGRHPLTAQPTLSVSPPLTSPCTGFGFQQCATAGPPPWPPSCPTLATAARVQIATSDHNQTGLDHGSVMLARRCRRPLRSTTCCGLPPLENSVSRGVRPRRVLYRPCVFRSRASHLVAAVAPQVHDRCRLLRPGFTVT